MDRYRANDAALYSLAVTGIWFSITKNTESCPRETNDSPVKTQQNEKIDSFEIIILLLINV